MASFRTNELRADSPSKTETLDRNDKETTINESDKTEKIGDLVLTGECGETGDVDKAANADGELQEEPLQTAVTVESPVWLEDYDQAWRLAMDQEKKLLIFFYEPELSGAAGPKKGSESEIFENKYLKNPEMASELSRYVLLRVPTNVTVGLLECASGNQSFRISPLIPSSFPLLLRMESTLDQAVELPLIALDRTISRLAGGLSRPFRPSAQDLTVRNAVLLKEPAFAEMLNRPGISIIDLENRTAPYYAKVVSVFPFLTTHHYGEKEVHVMLTLPSATLTQRTMIYAVRVHSEHPLSTEGLMHPVLTQGAESASAYQAQIRQQGHHNWDARFAQLTRQLPGGLWASEVCAEGWGWQNLLESALDCVHCWRQSSGHWRGVSSYHPYYGYDIKKGSNGIWYGTGLFGQYQAGEPRSFAEKKRDLALSRQQVGWTDENQLFELDRNRLAVQQGMNPRDENVDENTQASNAATASPALSDPNFDVLASSDSDSASGSAESREETQIFEETVIEKIGTATKEVVLNVSSTKDDSADQAAQTDQTSRSDKEAQAGEDAQTDQTTQVDQVAPSDEVAQADETAKSAQAAKEEPQADADSEGKKADAVAPNVAETSPINPGYSSNSSNPASKRGVFPYRTPERRWGRRARR